MRTKRRKAPVTTESRTDANPSTYNSKKLKLGNGTSASPHASASVIRRFHVLLKRKARLEKLLASGSSSSCTQPHPPRINESADTRMGWKDELSKLEAEIEDMGGLAAYQRMSTIGQGKDRGGGSEGVFIAWLDELGVKNDALGRIGRNEPMLRLLEVGALKPDNYASCSKWLDNTPIDLRSNHPEIRQQDFLTIDLEENAGKWGAISLSLVVNFVPDAHDRGKMLRNARTMLQDKGLLFVALPLPCVANSRYLTQEHFVFLMCHLGFNLLCERWKEGGKMAYWLFQRSETRTSLNGKYDERHFNKKAILREGKRNNFCILL